MSNTKRSWSREEFILVLNLYYKLPFGRLHTRTKEVQESASLMGRTFNSGALRLVNFAACAPYIRETGRKGMTSGMVQCQHYWDELSKDREGHIYESERILDKLQGTSIEQKYSSILNISDFTGEDKVSEVATRINQNVFREKVLSNYDYKCAITEIDIPL